MERMESLEGKALKVIFHHFKKGFTNFEAIIFCALISITVPVVLRIILDIKKGENYASEKINILEQKQDSLIESLFSF